MKKHTGKMARGAMHLKAIKGKDKMAHASHFAQHGVGDQAGMHGFGPNFSPPEQYQQGPDACGGGDNCEMED